MDKALHSPKYLATAFVAMIGVPFSSALGDANVKNQPVAASQTAITNASGENIKTFDVSTKQVARAKDGFFYVDARVNGVETRFLVDTGASVAVLTATDARRIGALPVDGPSEGNLETVGGQVSMVWTRLDEINIAGHVFHHTRAVIVQHGAGVSLIGQNLLSQFRTISVEGDRMTLL